MIITEEDQTLLWIHNKLTNWLDSNNYSHEMMISWLKGYELPPVGHEEEPYVWIFHALSGASKDTCRQFARYISKFLEEINWETGLADKRSDKILYNLFCICSGLHFPKETGKPLWNIFDFFERNKEKREILASKKYNLNGAFRGALISNQYDPKYKIIWKRMLNGESHDFLLGNEYSGFEGILNFNKSDELDAQPDTDEIGWALGKIIDYLEKNSQDAERQNNFRYLFKRIKETWSNFKNWDKELILQADKWKYPLWAILNFDALVIELDKLPNNRQRFYVWDFFDPYITVENSHLFQSIPIAELILDEDETKILNFIKTRVERKRLACNTLNADLLTKICNEDLKYMLDDWTVTLESHFEETTDIYTKRLNVRRLKKLGSIATEKERTTEGLLRIAEGAGAI
jgi:hypothetical protein